jgi:hypothetical protein
LFEKFLKTYGHILSHRPTHAELMFEYIALRLEQPHEDDVLLEMNYFITVIENWGIPDPDRPDRETDIPKFIKIILFNKVISIIFQRVTNDIKTRLYKFADYIDQRVLGLIEKNCDIILLMYKKAVTWRPSDSSNIKEYKDMLDMIEKLEKLLDSYTLKKELEQAEAKIFQTAKNTIIGYKFYEEKISKELQDFLKSFDITKFVVEQPPELTEDDLLNDPENRNAILDFIISEIRSKASQPKFKKMYNFQFTHDYDTPLLEHLETYKRLEVTKDFNFNFNYVIGKLFDKLEGENKDNVKHVKKVLVELRKNWAERTLNQRRAAREREAP